MLSAAPATAFTDPRHHLGMRGELAALAHYVREGWTLEAHRYRFGRHDIDLIVRRGSLVAFVEVKARSGKRCGAAVEAVGWRKRRILVQGAQWWSQRFGRRGDRYRFDLVALQDSPDGLRLQRVPDAWRLNT